jgi:hypothetical protein
MAWAASVACLLFGHITLNGAGPSAVDGPALPLTAAATADGELADVVGLSRLTVSLPAFDVAVRSSNQQPASAGESERVR